jgi:hypothetical protein
VGKGRGKRGRPSQQLPTEAAAKLKHVYSISEVRSGTAYSRTKRVYQCMCSNSKHVCIRADDTVSRTLRTLKCRMCNKGGSSYEQGAYRLLDNMPEVTEYAAEVHAVQGTIKFEGGQLNLGSHRWDILVLQPARVLLAVQGEQHDEKPDNRANSISADLHSSIARDHALAAGAVGEGFHVVWLVPGDRLGRSARWRAVIKQAVAAAVQQEPCKLHIT